MRVSDFNEGLICNGDFVMDRMSEECRQIESIIVLDSAHASVLLVDGGVMSLREIKSEDIRLESEVS